MIGLNELNIRKNDILYNKYNISAIYGIYVDNELVYIGSSVNCMKRFLQHKYKIFLQEESNVKKLRLLERKYLQKLHPKFNIKPY